jgi:hypothetical protein
MILLWNSTNWKARLERQAPFFYYFSFIPRLPFRKDHITDLTGDVLAYATAERGLSPTFYKLIPGDSEPTLVRRGLVQVTKGPSIIIDGSE